MLGPVLYYEMLLGSRRSRQQVFRWIYAGWLFLMYFGAAVGYLFTFGPAKVAPFSEGFVHFLLVQHFIILFLATPAFVASAITEEKISGTLQYLLTADLTPAEIVWGKFLGRSAQVIVLALTSLPMIAFCGVFAGLDFFKTFALIVDTALILFAIGAASILASVLTRHSRDAVLGLYTVAGVAVCAYYLLRLAVNLGVPGSVGCLAMLDTYVVRYVNPFTVPNHIWACSGFVEFMRGMLAALLVWGTFGGTCLFLAILYLRGMYVRQLENEGKKRKARWWRARRVNLGDDPIRWKERQIEGVAPFVVLRSIPTWLGMLAIVLVTTASSGLILWFLLPDDVTLKGLYYAVLNRDVAGLRDILTKTDDTSQAFRAQAIVVMFLASLVVAIRCSGAVSGEREKHTWEALLLTPISTRHLLRGKLWGIIGASHPYLLAYAVPAVLLAFLGGPMALFWTLIWLCATWLAMYYVGAAGIWSSVRSKSSWRSLLGTLGFCYVGGVVIFGPLALIILIGTFIVLMIVSQVNQSAAAGAGKFLTYYWDVYNFAMCLGLAACFFGLAKLLLYFAEQRIGYYERTRHWEHDPNERFYRRRPVPIRPRVSR